MYEICRVMPNMTPNQRGFHPIVATMGRKSHDHQQNAYPVHDKTQDEDDAEHHDQHPIRTDIQAQEPALDHGSTTQFVEAGHEELGAQNEPHDETADPQSAVATVPQHLEAKPLYISVRTKAPRLPRAAASVGAAKPKKIPPRTANIRPWEARRRTAKACTISVLEYSASSQRLQRDLCWAR